MLTTIKEIINPDVVINIDTGNKIVTVKETGADSKIKKLHIKNVPENAFAFTLDHQPGGRDNRLFKQLSCYVNVSNKRGINRGCDLVLFIPVCEKENRWSILIFDLKSDKPDIKGTEKQLLNSELYVRYLMTMVKNHYDLEIDSVEYKRAIVTTGVRKKAIYSPNEKGHVAYSFRIEPVKVNKQQVANVHIGALLR